MAWNYSFQQLFKLGCYVFDIIAKTNGQGWQ